MPIEEREDEYVEKERLNDGGTLQGRKVGETGNCKLIKMFGKA